MLLITLSMTTTRNSGDTNVPTKIHIYVYIWWPPPQNLHFSKKHWFLQCFRHILTFRFGKLRLGGHISSSYIKINDIHCTTEKCGMFRNTSVSKTEKLKNCFFSRDIQGEILHKKTVFQFFSFLVLSPEMFRKSSVSKTEKLKNCFFQRHPGRDSP